MADLKSLSFITEKPGKGYKIHDLVNCWAQAQLEDADLQVIAEHAASIVTSTLILDSNVRASSEWEYERKIMSQIDHCYDFLQTRLALKDMNDQTRSIACKLAKVYEYHNNAEKAEVLVQSDFADVSDLEGHYHEALKAYEKLHDVYKRRSGAGGKASMWELRAAVDIGRVLDKIGHYKRALQLLEETAQTMKKREEDGESENHFLTPASVLRVGNVHESQGQYDKALESYNWVRKRCREARGRSHYHTGSSVLDRKCTEQARDIR